MCYHAGKALRKEDGGAAKLPVIAVLYLMVYLACGVMCVRFLLPRHPVLNRVWLGLCLGLLMLMWFPALIAFLVKFSLLAHGLALIPLALATLGCFLARDKRPVKPWDSDEAMQLAQLLVVAVPLTVLSGYLQWTHNLRQAADGAWYVGQSTYGDLPMHTAFITGLKNRAFPADYPFYPGHQLSYPFLMDSLSTTFYLFDWSLQASINVPGTLMMGLCYMGVMLLAREMTLGRKTVVLATLLFFLNGGLGFLYDFDQAAGFEADGSLTIWSRLRNILEGYYQTPTNKPDPDNLRWSNVIVDMMVPQRTTLGGWCMVIPCFYLLYTGFDPSKRERLGGTRTVTLLAVWGSGLPLIQTHSFLALGLASAGYMIYDLIHDAERKKLLVQYLIYAGIVVVLAAPQLFGFTFRQTFMPEEEAVQGLKFMDLQFNWVNNPGGNGMRDFYFWFYVKNIGIPVIGLVLALLEKDKRTRRIFAGAFAVILAAELIRFQPNEYDNNKLFYLAWLLCCMIVADYAAKVWRKLRGLRARPVIAVGAAVVLFLSAGLSIARECVSNYQAYGKNAVEAGLWVRDHTEEDAVFLTGNHHLNPVDSIAGRTVLCGPGLWLHWHGFNTAGRVEEIREFYQHPAEHLDTLEKYGVDYIYVSSYERNDFRPDVDALNSLFEVVFQNYEATVWKVAGT